MTKLEQMYETIALLTMDAKGILAADESTSTIAKRFAAVKIENTEENRRQYRELLFTAPDLSDYISGVILFEETFYQQDKHGKTFPELLLQQGIVPGIKVDKGLIDLSGTDNEQISTGLDDLAERLVHFRNLGARFAKWRNVFKISQFTPTKMAIKAGTETLARYAAICQDAGIVPIIEPEILMDGSHDILSCADVTSRVLHELFNNLYDYNVDLRSIILKTNMITAGKEHAPFSTPEEVADFTAYVLCDHVPVSVPSVNFLSGGQSPQQAADNLNSINLIELFPWNVSFSYGRALQQECLKTWQGKAENIEAAQHALIHACQQNSLASVGELYEVFEDSVCEHDHLH